MACLTHASDRGRRQGRREWPSCPTYIASIASAYFSAIGLRLSFIVGVSSSPPGSQSPATIVNFLICSTRASFSLAASTPSWTAARTALVVRERLERGVRRCPAAAAHAGAKSASSTISAVL